MTENNMLPSALLEEIHSLKENMERITGFILELKQDYAVLEEKIELNSSDVLRLLGISRASLARWRDSKVVPYRYVSCNHVVYPFKGLYIAIKTGRASFKGFWKSHTNLTHPGKYFRPSKVKIMRPTSPK